jgi:hypothetical protein
MIKIFDEELTISAPAIHQGFVIKLCKLYLPSVHRPRCFLWNSQIISPWRVVHSRGFQFQAMHWNAEYNPTKESTTVTSPCQTDSSFSRFSFIPPFSLCYLCAIAGCLLLSYSTSLHLYTPPPLHQHSNITISLHRKAEVRQYQSQNAEKRKKQFFYCYNIYTPRHPCSHHAK